MSPLRKFWTPSPIGATYQRNHFGPTPMEFGALVESMEQNRELVRVQQPYFDFTQKKYLPLRDPDLSKLNARGARVTTLVDNETREAGAYRVDWNGQSKSGVTVSSGVYFARIQQNGATRSKKLVLIK